VCVCVCMCVRVCVCVRQTAGAPWIVLCFNPSLRRPHHSRVATSTIHPIPKGKGGGNEKREGTEREGGGDRREEKKMNQKKEGDSACRDVTRIEVKGVEYKIIAARRKKKI